MINREVIDGYVENSLASEQYYVSHDETAELVLNGLAKLYNDRDNSPSISPGQGVENYRFNSWVETSRSKMGYALALPSVYEVTTQDFIRPIFFSVDRKNREILSETSVVMPRGSDIDNNPEKIQEARSVLTNIFSQDDLQFVQCLVNKAYQSLHGMPNPIDGAVHAALATDNLDELSKNFSNRIDQAEEDATNIEKLAENWLEFEASATHRFIKKDSRKGNVSEVAIMYELNRNQTYAIKLTGTRTTVLMAEIVMQHGNEVESQNYIFSSALNEDDMQDNYDYAPEWSFEDLHETLELGNYITPDEFTAFHAEALDASSGFNSNLLYEGNVIDFNRDAA